jgi:pimeloyl-ACP methyl ester carboxylesterase
VRSRVRQVFVMLVMVLGAWIATVPATAQAGSDASAPGGGPKASDSSLVTPSDIPGSECVVVSWGVPYVVAGDSLQVTATITTAATQSGTTCTQSSTPITSGTITIQILSNSCTGAVIASASYPLNGTNSVTESLSTGAGSNLPAGTYAISATYDGGDGATSPSCGTLPVDQASPSITQTVQDVPLGAGTQDTAKVTAGDFPTGTVTMGLYSNSGCTSLVYSNTQTLSGGTATSASYTPTKAGTYYWSATYNGDTNNTSASSGCEAVNVGKVAAPPITPTTPTVPATVTLSLSSSNVTTGTSANATIGVSGPAGFAPGTLYVRIYASPTCDAAQVAVASNAINETTGIQDSFGTGTGGLKAGQYGVQAAYQGGTGGVEATGSSACVPLTVVLPAAAVVFVSGLDSSQAFSDPTSFSKGCTTGTWAKLAGGFAAQLTDYRVFDAPADDGKSHTADCHGTQYNAPAAFHLDTRDYSDDDTDGTILLGFLGWLHHHYGINDVWLVGHSYGGIWSRSALTQLTAGHHPIVHIDGLITVGTPHTGSFGADLYSTAASTCADALFSDAARIACGTAVGVRAFFGNAINGLTHNALTAWNASQTQQASWGCVPIATMAGTEFSPLVRDRPRAAELRDAERRHRRRAERGRQRPRLVDHAPNSAAAHPDGPHQAAVQQRSRRDVVLRGRAHDPADPRAPPACVRGAMSRQGRERRRHPVGGRRRDSFVGGHVSQAPKLHGDPGRP